MYQHILKSSRHLFLHSLSVSLLNEMIVLHSAHFELVEYRIETHDNQPQSSHTTCLVSVLSSSSCNRFNSLPTHICDDVLLQGSDEFNALPSKGSLSVGLK